MLVLRRVGRPLGAGFRGIPPIFVSITVKTSLSGGVLPVAVPSITGDRGF
jgi:hypothetical protein